MLGFLKAPSRLGVRQFALGAGCVALLACTAWGLRGYFLSGAAAQQARGTTLAAGQAPGAPPTAETSDYTQRVVAYVHETEAITRRDLGEYLIARHGPDKLTNLVNQRIIQHACLQRGLTVTAGEVEHALAEDAKNAGVEAKSFVQLIQSRYQKNLTEWKEDVVRQRLLMNKLCRDRVSVTEEDLRRAFESQHGEKVQLRMILWPLDQYAAAKAAYPQIVASDEAFVLAAKHQPDGGLACVAGKLKPVGRYAFEPQLEREAFKLRKGEVSELLKTEKNYVVLKCDDRFAADTTANFEAVRAKLAAQVREQKAELAMRTAFQGLLQEAKPSIFLAPPDKAPEGPPPPPSQVVAYVYGNVPITREDLGEYLIDRFGVQALDFLINRRIIDRACRARGISITRAEIDAALEQDLAKLHTDRARFQKEVLGKMGKTVHEWCEDVVRTRLLLDKLCRAQVKVTEEDMRKGFEALHGEKRECRIILWPHDQKTFAMREYPQVINSEAQFSQKAKTQASPSLAAKGGSIPAFARHTLGDEELERAAFALNVGEISALVGTAQGNALIKCDRIIPPNPTVRLEHVRDQLGKEVFERKVQVEMQKVFIDLRAQANPKPMLRDASRPSDLLAENRQIQRDMPSIRPGPAPRTGR